MPSLPLRDVLFLACIAAGTAFVVALIVSLLVTIARHGCG